MKKKSVLFRAIASALAIGIFTGASACAKKLIYTEKSDVTLSNYEDHKIDMKVDVVRNRKLLVTLKNNSEKTYMYGEEFSIEYKTLGSWFKVPMKDGHAWTAVGIMLGPADEYAIPNEEGYKLANTVTDRVYLDCYDTLPAGHYRLIKQILKDNTDDAYYLAAEFDLEKESDEIPPLQKTTIPEDKLVPAETRTLPVSYVKLNYPIELEILFTKYSAFGEFYLQYMQNGEWCDVLIRSKGGNLTSDAEDNMLLLYLEDTPQKGTYRLLHAILNDKYEVDRYVTYTFEL